MYNKKPPFEITASILDKIAEIAELVGQVNISRFRPMAESSLISLRLLSPQSRLCGVPIK